MRFPLLRACFVFSPAMCLVVLQGCNRATESDDPPVQSAPILKTAADPLTESDVALFFQIVQRMPGGKVPDFQPFAGVPIDEQLPADALIKAYQFEFRDRIDPSREGTRWRKDPEVKRAIEQQGITPEEFAALVVRVSFAVAAEEALPSPDEVETLLERLHAQLELLAKHASRPTVAPMSAAKQSQRSAVAQSICNTVALLEFLDLMRSVPDESRDVVRANRKQLANLLPDMDSSRRAFQTWSKKIGQSPSERAGDIQPASFERDAR